MEYGIACRYKVVSLVVGRLDEISATTTITEKQDRPI